MWDRWLTADNSPVAFCMSYQLGPWLVALSYLTVVVAACLAFTILTGQGDRRIQFALAAIVLGAGLVAMHFAGMLGTCILPHQQRSPDSAPDSLSAALGGAALLVVGLAFVAAVFHRRLQAAHNLLLDAVDSVAAGLVIYDRDDRFVIHNDAYRKLIAPGGRDLVTGAKFLDTLRAAAARGDFPGAIGREAEWLAEWEVLHRDGAGHREELLADGRWMLATKRRMRNGGIAGLWVDITQFKRTQEALRASEAQLDRAQQIAKIGCWTIDLKTGQHTWSKEMFAIRGLSRDTFRPSRDAIAPFVHADDLPVLDGFLASLKSGVPTDAAEYRGLRPDGTTFVGRVEGKAETDNDGNVRELVGTLQDVTEYRQTELKLAQAQKMEAIGQFTGGIAHDFNNMLGVIMGNIDMVKRRVGADPLAVELCDDALDGAERGADLIRRLLAFARRQPLRPSSIDINALIRDVARLMRRTLGEMVDLHLMLRDELPPVVIDAVQLESALVNIATNARDAMPKGGKLIIATRALVISSTPPGDRPDLHVGSYIVIDISDNGSGMPPEIVARIFEPFFTTKSMGRGTGLGLSMAFGFVKQSGGHLTVHSEPGTGSTFSLYLPSGDRTQTETIAPADRTDAASGDDTILVVEDDEHLRRATIRQLRSLGYTVLDADGPRSALDILSHDNTIGLLCTDVVMPGTMDGLELADQAREMHPGLRILLTSGYPAVRNASRQLAHFQFDLLQKPYSRAELANAVRSALSRETGDGKAPETERRPNDRRNRARHDESKISYGECQPNACPGI